MESSPICQRRRSERKKRVDIIKEEQETIRELLSITDDSTHGIEVAPIENKGRGIKVGINLS